MKQKHLFIQLILQLILLTTSLALAESRFLEKNYLHVRQQGFVHVDCRNTGFGDSYNSFWCEGSFLSPTSAAHFVTTQRSDLHHVSMKIITAEGETTAQWRLNRFTGKTLFSIPLWGNSGILRLGTNRIQYSVENKANQSLETGAMETVVSDSPLRECRPILITSMDPSDCQFPGFACQQLSFPRSECRGR